MSRRGGWSRVRVAAWLESVEAAWLGWSQPPPSLVLREAGWSADDPTRFCQRCGVTAACQEQTPQGCGSCRGRTAPADGVVRLGRYAIPLRDWVRAIKYQRWSAMAQTMGRELGRAVRGCRGGGDYVVVPMPMPWARRIHRGIDHAREVAVAVAHELRAPVRYPLCRVEGPPQVALSVSNRGRGGAGLRLRERRDGTRSLAGRTVILVDDVCTTGASLRHGTRLLRRLGPKKVVAAVLAVADPPNRRGAKPVVPV